MSGVSHNRTLPVRFSRARIVVAMIALCALVVLSLSSRSTDAQLGAFQNTSVEQEALSLMQEEKYIGARTKAEEALRANNRSFIGHYVLGTVLYTAEGSLARSLFHLGKARELYETTFQAGSQPAGAPTELHRDLLFRVQQVAGQMDMYEYQLEVIGYHGYLYDPDMVGEHAWPLMQLGQLEHARQYARQARDSRDEWQRSLGHNGLCAIEGKAGRR